MISNGSVEWVNEIDREVREDLTIIVSENIEGNEVYTLEIDLGNNQFIYLTSTLNLDELLEYTNLQL